MAEYLVDHDKRQVQWGRTRRGGSKPSGVVVIHTAESVADRVGLDTGAENVAAWIARRNPAKEGYGSYHVLCDSDSTIKMVPWASEAWHDTSSNPHSVGISAAVRTSDWATLGARGRAIVIRMAHAAAEYAKWLKATRGITIPAKKITRAQALAKTPGFVAHGTMDPGRRSDPGKDFDWNLFLRTYADAMNGEEIGMDEKTKKATREAAFLGGYDVLAEGAKRETPTGRQIGNNIRAIVTPSVWAHLVPGSGDFPDEYAYTHLRRATYLWRWAQTAHLDVLGYKGKDETRDVYSYLRNTHRMVEQTLAIVENIAGAVAALKQGEDFDQAKFIAGVEEAAQRGATRGAEDVLADIEQVVRELLADVEGLDEEEVARQVLAGLGRAATEASLPPEETPDPLEGQRD